MNDKRDIERLRVLVESQFRVINSKLSSYDRNLLKILKRLEQEINPAVYHEIGKDQDIKVTSYMDE